MFLVPNRSPGILNAYIRGKPPEPVIWRAAGYMALKLKRIYWCFLISSRNMTSHDRSEVSAA